MPWKLNIGKFIVEDDVDMHDPIRETIRLSGIESEFEIVEDPEPFLDKLSASMFSICVVDHVLHSHRTGLDVCREVKENNKWNWVIIMTGQQDKKVVEKYLNAGANKYIDKDWSETELKEVIGPGAPHKPTYLDALAHFLKDAFYEARERIEIMRFIDSMKLKK